MPDYTSIPGVRTEVQDFGTRITPPILGPKVTVIGFTDNPNVPLEDPYTLTRFEDVYSFDNADGTPSELTKKIEELMAGQGRNVEIFVLSDGSGNRYTGATVTPQQRYAMMARAYELLLHHDVDIILPVEAPIDMTGLLSTQNFGYQLANFCYQSTKEYNSAIGVIGVQPPSVAVAGTGIPSLALQTQHVNALVAFDTSALLGTNFVIYDGVTDADLDGIPDNYAFLATMDESIPVGSPPWYAANTRLDAKHQPIDIGGYIRVVAGWCRVRNEAAKRINPVEGYYNANGNALVAGLISTLPPEVAITNRVLAGGEMLRNLSASQANDLSRSRYISFWSKPTGFVVVSGVTGAHYVDDYHRSDFTRDTTVRITQDAINVVRNAAQPFIGLPNNGVNRSALENAIDSALGKMQERGALEGFRFSVTSTPTMRVLGQIMIDLTIVAAFEIQSITIRIGLSAA